jgi:hypothetical protein
MPKIGFIVVALALAAACVGEGKDRDDQVRANNGLGVAFKSSLRRALR